MDANTMKDKELHEHRKQMYDSADAYRRSFINSETGLLDDKYLESRYCPVCGSEKHRVIFLKNGGQYVVCENCSMVFLNPVFKDEFLESYYINNNANQAGAHVDESTFYRSIYSSGIDQIATAKNCSTILDIGCSSGLFLDIAKERGFETFGIELNKLEFNIAVNKGHKVWNEPVDRVEFPFPFDVITLWDVFEHIKDGQAYLRFLRSHLVEDGLIFMQIPSSQSLAARILHERCNMFDGLEHVNLYNEKTIRHLVDQVGYDVVGLKSVIDELGPVNNYLHYEDPYFGSFKGDPSISFLSPEVIHQELLGYKFQITLKVR
jgi:SAM-dependent methyltransferase